MVPEPISNSKHQRLPQIDIQGTVKNLGLSVGNVLTKNKTDNVLILVASRNSAEMESFKGFTPTPQITMHFILSSLLKAKCIYFIKNS